MQHKSFYLFVLLFFTPLFYSQSITGSLTDENGGKIGTANVFIKEEKDTNKIKGFVIAKDGTYTIQLKQPLQTFFVEVNATGYKKITKEVKNFQGNLTLDFVFEKEGIKTIKEVVIKKEKITIKKDTVVYDVNSFKDLSDNKLQDVLKKMPGITVNEKTGAVKYKGKPIVTVKLEDDDLFGSNYTVGTKNINVDIVEKVEVIQKYSENPLLKGIENSDKVALNLKLKKGKIDFSGNFDWGSGFNSEAKQLQLINSSILQVAKKFKSFFSLSYNNIGVNNSPYDHFSNSNSISQENNKNYSSIKLINDLSFNSSFLEENRLNKNNQLFTSYNLSFKPVSKMSTRVNLSYIKDKLTQNLYNKTILLNENYNLSDNFNSVKEPEVYHIETNSKYYTSKKSLLEYNLLASKTNTNQESSIIQNDVKNYNNTTSTQDKFFKQTLKYTYKINDATAMQVNSNYSYNNIPQKTLSIPYFYINDNDYFKQQNSHFQKQILDIQSILLGRTRTFSYLFSLGNSNEITKYNSNIEGNSASVDSENYRNKFRNRKNSIYTSAQINFKIGDLGIQPSANLIYLKQKHSDQNAQLSKNNLLVEPKLHLILRLSKISNLMAQFEYSQKPFSEDKLISNPVFIDNRNSISSIPSLEIQKTWNGSLNYGIYDMYNQFSFNIGLSHSINQGNYFSEYSISPNHSVTRFFYKPTNQSSLGLNFSVKKYLSFIDSTIELISNSSTSHYQNIVNNSDFRKIESNSFHNELTLKTSFDFFLNFNNNIAYGINTSKIENEDAKNTIHSFRNHFKIIAKPNKKWLFITSFEYFRPNLDTKKDYFFIDSTLTFKLNKKWSFNAIANNVLNKKQINETDITDYSISTTDLLIIPRYFMLGTSFSF